ncbi:MAG: PHP domain-containing protein [Acidobacteriota bacterium]|nr:PHP domain-containing protein [Acidobacteriota bacterium]
MAGTDSALRFDLQSHSTYSDGELDPSAVVERAATAGVELLALTDHDTVEGVSAALASGAQHGVRVVPAVEISSVDDGRPAPCELHILGYGIDHAAPPVQARLAEFLEDRKNRTLRMADALRAEGFTLDEETIAERVEQGRSIGRLHLAEGALSRPENSARLREEGIADVGDFIRAYLIEGRSAFRMRATPSIGEAVEMIHDAGGVAVWAHPFWDLTDPSDVTDTIDRFHALGMDGVEAFYISHTREQTDMIAQHCAGLDMLTTGSADFHGPENSIFSRFMAFETFGHTPNLGPIAA